jgi:hypothetical protein
MYNGALVIPLNADMPDSRAPNPVLEDLWERVRELVNERSVLIERRTHQIQFQAAKRAEISTRALAQLIREMAARTPSLNVKCVQSAHSIMDACWWNSGERCCQSCLFRMESPDSWVDRA